MKATQLAAILSLVGGGNLHSIDRDVAGATSGRKGEAGRGNILYFRGGQIHTGSKKKKARQRNGTRIFPKSWRNEGKGKTERGRMEHIARDPSKEHEPAVPILNRELKNVGKMLETHQLPEEAGRRWGHSSRAWLKEKGKRHRCL